MATINSALNPVNTTNILQWNVRSLIARLPTLQYLLSYNKCSIALLSETWLLPTRLFNIPDFSFLRSDRQDGYGGAAVLVHNSLRSRFISIDGNTRKTFSNFRIDIVGAEVFYLICLCLQKFGLVTSLVILIFLPLFGSLFLD
jgi:uncharacterized membrane protein